MRPDAVLEVAQAEGEDSRLFFIEYDRTRRVDKNYEKFRRYDAFLCWWSTHTGYGDGELPFVIFICQDDDQRDRFLAAADHELTGHLWHPFRPADQHVYTGRQRVLFACELDVHTGQLEARRVPRLAPGHAGRRNRDACIRRVRLPGDCGRLKQAAA